MILPTTSKASVFSGAIFRLLPSNQRFARRRLSSIYSFRFLMSSAAHVASESFAKPNGFSERLFSTTMWLCSRCRIISFKSLHTVSNRHIGLYDEAFSRGLSFFLRRTNLCLFHSSKDYSSRIAASHSSSRQSVGDYIEGENIWVLFDLINQVFTVLKSTLLFFSCLKTVLAVFHALCSRASSFSFHPLSECFPPRCESFTTQENQSIKSLQH